MFKKINKKILSFFLILLLIFGLCGCVEGKYDNYSVGLDENGYYEGLKKGSLDLSSFSNLKFTVEEVLNWSCDEFKSDNEDIKSVEDYVKYYGKELLANLNLSSKDVAEETDIVNASLEFIIDGKSIDEFNSTWSYKATSSGDNIIKSFIGRKKGDEYEVKYTIPDDDEEYAGKAATVKIKINSIVLEDPFSDKEIITKNKKVINEFLPGATDTESFLKLLRPKIAEARLSDFLSDYVQNSDCSVPKEYTDFEVYRLKTRLQKLGYSFKQYIKEKDISEAATVELCEMAARENYVLMLICLDNDKKVTDELFDSRYSDTKEQIESIQGIPYMKTTILREIGLSELMKNTTLIDADGNEIKIKKSVETE